jgi:hypothetical protein
MQAWFVTPQRRSVRKRARLRRAAATHADGRTPEARLAADDARR